MKFDTRRLVLCAAVAAVYTVMSYFGSIFGLTYGPIQCRFAEALCVLPFFFPETVWGLFTGCVLTNLMSAYGPIDVVFGSLATLLAGLATARMRDWRLAPLPPVLANGIIIGAVISWMETGASGAFWAAFAYNGISVAIGEALACYGLGTVLLHYLPKSKYFSTMMRQR